MNRRIAPWLGSPAVVLALLACLMHAPAAWAKNNPPQISGNPSTSVRVGAQYLFRPSAVDPDGDLLRFSIARKPGWASFDVATGALTGAPGPAHVGVYSNIRISVSDGRMSRNLPAFSISVQQATTGSTSPTNTAPTISGTPPATVLVGEGYTFQPTATDREGDLLTFSVQNKPVWASFSTSTGRLSGTPGTSHVGTDTSISIGVSDGKVTTQLAPFSITVAAVVTSTVTLSWTPPTTNTDGSPLVDLADFRVSYGQASGSYDHTVTVGHPSVTSVELQDLGPGTWYFAVKAVTSRGTESEFSREASKTLQ